MVFLSIDELSVIVTSIPVMGGLIAWLVRGQVNMWLSLRDVMNELGISKNHEPPQPGSVKADIQSIKETAQNTNEQIQGLREELIAQGIIKPKSLYEG